MDFDVQFKHFAGLIENGLEDLMPAADTPPARLHEAMRYAMLSGGKRMRPVLLLAAADLYNPGPAALPAAVAVECVHTYSLIHDDLPCMDDDDLRRGRPTVHKAFDEATAVLAGDALLTHAFWLLSRADPDNPGLAQALVAELASAAGSRRLIGGQMADLAAEANPRASAADVDFIHLNKTAAMIEAALVMGGLCGAASGSDLETLRGAGRHLGMAFQILDDVLDITSETSVLGKTAGKDRTAEKTTFVSIHGLEGARQRADAHTREAAAGFSKLPGGAPFLTRLAGKLGRRKK